MKRYLWIAAFAVLLAGCLSPAVYADVEKVSYTAGSNGMNVTISGAAESPGGAISLEVLKDGVTAEAFGQAADLARIGMIDYARETEADTSGAWSFQIQLKDSQENQRLFRVRTTNGKVTVLPVYGIDDAVAAVNNAGAAEMEDVLEKYSPFMNYKSSYAYTEVFASFDSGSGGSDGKRQYVYSRFGQRKDFSSVGEIDAAFAEYTAMALIAKARGGDELLEDMPACAQILNLDMADYNALSSSQKEYVCSGLLTAFEDAVFSKTQLETKFAELVAEAKANVEPEPKPPTVNPGGGGGTGGGGSHNNKGGGFGGGSGQFEAPADITSPGQSNGGTFADLGSVEWARESIEALASRGIINGKAEGVFAPNDLITREEFVKMAVEAFGVADAAAECDFSDVVKDAWYYHYVGAALQSGLVSGMGDGSFGVGLPITRQDMATLLWNGVGSRVTAEAGAEFEDSGEIADYAKTAVTMLRGAGMIDGVGGNTFEPVRNATRAEAAKLLYQILQVIM